MQVGLNALADLSHEEYRHRLGYRPDLRQGELRAPTEFMYGNASAPPSIDWRKKGGRHPRQEPAAGDPCTCSHRSALWRRTQLGATV